AKIYAKPPDDHTSRKLGAMVQLGTEALAAFAAWPQNVLHDPSTGNVVGFLMPRVEGHREIHTLYGPTNRKTAFPDATWTLLVRAARNVATAFATVHAHGHVVGDVNQGNVIVSRKGTVQLIDCDSFQITHLGRTYPCRVGVPLFTPPELQGQRLEGVVRTPDHDRFGLAILVFHLLFMGRHPFAGRHPERAIGVQEAIREGLFAFGWEAARQGWQPPPFSLRLGDVSPSLSRLFENAFGREAATGSGRPTAAEWAAALEDLEGKTAICGDDPRHAYLEGNGACPWCRIEKDGGPAFFFLPPGASPDAFDLALAWQAIEAVHPPGPAPGLPQPDAKGMVGRPLPLPLLRTRLLRHAVVGLALVAAVASLWFGKLIGLIGYPTLACLVALRRTEAEREEREKRLAEVGAAEVEVDRFARHWDQMCGDATFVARHRELEEARRAIEGLRAVEEHEWQGLAARYRELGFEDHLKGFVLEFARIPGLGPQEIRLLLAAGVSTAADVTAGALEAIPGIDHPQAQALLLFREVAARSFVVDPVALMPEREQNDLAERQLKRHDELAKTLQAGALELAELRRQILTWRDVLGRAHDGPAQRLAQARADLRRS
ncbi:MAG TPA: hypothetical protein VMV21_18205, partial [Vicinamibacteria bacterium]|nr:hypothetical protein [Vicinamibacteria bacterium]